jgi:hypothetical protein
VASIRTSRAMSDPIEFLRKDDILAVLRRASVPEETLHALDAALPDPVGLTDAANIPGRYGITLDSVISAMGGSP